MTKRPHDPEIRAAVVAALLAGQSVSQVAREYEIPKGTVSAWKRRGVARDATQKTEGVGALLLELLEANLRGLIAASALLQDEAWLREQGAAELGTLLGITHDKTVRMLEAMDRSAG